MLALEISLKMILAREMGLMLGSKVWSPFCGGVLCGFVPIV